MDSAKSVLQSIVLATQQVRNATSRYSTTRDIRQVRQHSLVRLESEFQTIVDASRAILEILDDPRLRRHYMLDDRLVDWLSNTEPDTCLDTLRKMERSLNIRVDREVQVFSGFTPTKSTCDEDDINAAVVLFHAHKAHFHFLLTTDIWNYEKEDLRKAVPSQAESALSVNHTREDRVQGHSHGQPQPTPTKNLTIGNQRKEIISRKLNKLLKLLDAVNCSRKHRETSCIRQSDTCMWLPAMDVYRSWRDGTDSFLWLQGKAGAGKSILASFVINDLNNTTNDGEFLAYFYCDFRMKRSTSAVEVMRSILAQLTAHLCVVMADPEDLLDELLKESDSRVDSFYNPKGLSRYLSKVAGLCPRTPFVVIDALDECREMESLLDGLIMSSGDVQIFATTRPLQNIISILSPFPCISMDKMASELSADILLHVTRELDSHRRLRTFDERLKEEIRSKLCARADGMFRWVQCQIDTLEKCSSVSEIRRVLGSLPEGLEETYRRILLAIDRRLSDARLVRRALVWLVASQRPMRMRELLEALAIDPIRRVLDTRFALIKGADLLDVCRSLVVHHEETDIITLSHMSVKEYLVGELVYAKLPRYHIVLEDAHERLARFCMAYIAFCLDQMKESKDRSSILMRDRDLRLSTSYTSPPLLKYVLSHGFSHLAHLGSGNTEIFKDMESLRVAIHRYAWEWDQMCKLVPSIRSGVPWPTSGHDFTLYTLIAFASDSLFQTFLSRTAFAPREGTNPLVYAAHFGKTEHARILISRGANVNDGGLIVDDMATNYSDADKLDEDGSDPDNSDVGNTIDHKATPLEVAIDHWHAEIVDLLLAQGSIAPDRLLAHVLGEQPHDFPLYIIQRMLYTAEFTRWTITSWDNWRLLEALVDDVEDHEHLGGGDELILAIRRLVEVGCAETLLLVAVEKECIPVVRTLLSMNPQSASNISSASHTNAIVNAFADNGDTPLHVAMRLSDEKACLVITKLLVDAGCSPCELDADDKPPIHIAVMRGFVSVVDYLLSRDVPLPSRILFAALQVTLLKRVEMIRLLVSKGANVSLTNPAGDTLLHATMRSLDRSVCLEIAELLIDVGCNPSTYNLRGETPLHIAAKQGYDEVVNYLFLFSASSDVFSMLYPTPLGQSLTFRSLIGNMDRLRFRPEEEDRLLQAIRQFLDDEDKCLESAKKFVSAAGDLFGRSSGSAMLFDIAVRQEFGLVVGYLVSQNVPFPPGILFTALQYQPSMFPLLVTNGVDVHIQDDDGDSLIQVAMSAFEQVTVCSFEAARIRHIYLSLSRAFLLHAESQTKGPLPPDLLFTALQHGYYSMVRLLVDRGADVTQLAPNGDSAVHIAVRSKSLRTVQVVIEAGCSSSAPDADGKTPLHIAIALGLNLIVDYLLSRDVPLPSDILLIAFQQSITVNHGILTSLIRNGANVHARDANGNTLIHRATQFLSDRQPFDAVRILIEAGCSPSMRNSRGELPIEIAVHRAQARVVKHLLSREASFPPDIILTALRARDKFQEDVLSVVSSLVRSGADACVLAANGDTALHVALANEKEWSRITMNRSYLLDVVEILVQAGCNIHGRDAKGRTSIEVAEVTGYSEVAEYLRDFIAG